MFDNIKWNRLDHAYGMANDTHEQLKNLLGADFQLRNDSWEHFYSAVVHQGSTYTVTPVVNEIFLSLIKDNHPALREDMSEFYLQKEIQRLEKLKEYINTATNEKAREYWTKKYEEQKECIESKKYKTVLLVDVIGWFRTLGYNLSEFISVFGKPEIPEIVLPSDVFFYILNMADAIVNVLTPLTSDSDFMVAEKATKAIAVWKEIRDAEPHTEHGEG